MEYREGTSEGYGGHDYYKIKGCENLVAKIFTAFSFNFDMNFALSHTLTRLSRLLFNPYSLAFLGHFSVALCETYSEKDVAIWQFN